MSISRWWLRLSRGYALRQVHVPSPHYRRQDTWLSVGRMEADLLHFCSAAVHAFAGARGSEELFRANMDAVRRTLEEVEKAADGLFEARRKSEDPG